MGCVLRNPPSVVAPGVALVDRMEALWAAHSEMCEGQRFPTAGVSVYLRGCTLGLGWGLVLVNQLQKNVG